MQEIRFRASEEQLIEEQIKRRKAYKLVGSDRIRCEKCGRYTYVMLNMKDMTYECECCWAKRRYLEIVDKIND